MKTIQALFWTAALILNSVLTAGLRGEAAPGSKLEAMKFLIGSWHGELPAQANGPKMAIESKFEWSKNHQVIRFESTWVIGDKRVPYTSGQYVWDPEKSRPTISYTDAEGALTTGTVEISGEVYQHELRLVDAGGRVSWVRAKLHHVDDRTYVNEIFTMKAGQWEKFVEVRYVRTD